MSEPQDNLVSLHGEQLVLEGFPIVKGMTRFNLVNDKRIATDRELHWNDFVEGTFRGRVKGLQYVEEKGELMALFIVEVLGADLT